MSQVQETFNKLLRVTAPGAGEDYKPYLLERGGYNSATNSGTAVIIADRKGRKKHLSAGTPNFRCKPNGVQARVPVGKDDIAVIVKTDSNHVTEGYMMRMDTFRRNEVGTITKAEARCIAVYNAQSREWEAIAEELPDNAAELITTAISKANHPNCRKAHWIAK